MKISAIILFIFLSVMSLTLNAEDDGENLHRDVIDKLLFDKVAYEQFLFIGKVRCYEKLKLGGVGHKIDYDAGWLSSGMLNYPIMTLIKKESLIGYFDLDMRSLIEEKKRNIALRAEKFYTYPRNGIYICESLHRDSPRNKKRYDGFIKDIANYRDIQVYGHQYESYLRNIIVNDKYW